MRGGSSAHVLKTRAIQELRDAILEVAAGRQVSTHQMDLFPQLDELVLHYQPIFALTDGCAERFVRRQLGPLLHFGGRFSKNAAIPSWASGNRLADAITSVA